MRPLAGNTVTLRVDTAWMRRLTAAGAALFALKGLAGYWLLER